MESSQPVENPLSERIKAARKALGLSRVKAAKTWSISAATIRAWEERKRDPSRWRPRNTSRSSRRRWGRTSRARQARTSRQGNTGRDMYGNVVLSPEERAGGGGGRRGEATGEWTNRGRS